MRRLLKIVLAVSLLSVLPAGTATTASAQPEGPVAANVELLGSIPDAAAIGGEVRTVTNALGEERRYLLATTLTGISAFDVTIPETPILVSHLLLPNVENEDVEMSDDVLLVVADSGFLTSRGGGLYIIDISQLPLMTFAYVNPATGNKFRVVTGSLAGMETPDQIYTTSPDEKSNYFGGHTVSCVADCDYALSVGGGGGSDTLYLIDLRTPSEPRLARIWDSPVGGTHDVQEDAAGISWLVGSRGFYAVDFRPNPENPRWISGYDTPGLGYHHNSWRPHADNYAPTTGGDPTPELSEGEVLLITEEEIYETCASQGQFATASVVNFEGAEPDHQVLDRWSTELRTPDNVGDPLTGNQPAAAVCSAHYFDYADGIVAIGWYQQGIRFLDVSDPTDIRQVGYFVAPNSATWAAVWNPGTDVVYSIDAGRGIDVLRFTGSAGATATVRADVPAHWLRSLPAGVSLDFDSDWGYACSLRLAPSV